MTGSSAVARSITSTAKSPYCSASRTNHWATRGPDLLSLPQVVSTARRKGLVGMADTFRERGF